MNESQNCPICTAASLIKRLSNTDAFQVECPRCGMFWITGPLLNNFRNAAFQSDFEPLRPYLSAATRQADQAGSFARLEFGNWRELAHTHSKTRVREKVTKLLRVIAAHTRHFGDKVGLNPALDYPLVDAASEEEFFHLLSYMVSQGLTEEVALTLEERSVRLTMEGWEVIEPQVVAGGIPNRSFVAMSFDPSLNDAYELGIRAAIVDDCKLPQPIRMDREQHNENISNRMLAEIRLAQFVIADFTFQRGGVYFEAGFAMALGRPVIWTCRGDHFKHTHFDTQQFNHIIWNDPPDLRSQLRDRILATISITRQ